MKSPWAIPNDPRMTEPQFAPVRGDLTFLRLSEENVHRACRWHPGFPTDDTWNGADWSNAMCGEAGEAANVVKKLRRHETGHHGALDGDEAELRNALADELADVVIYADLLAEKYDISLADAIVRKFNVVSERQGFPERLP
jgi:NTP pyrophosphatase (non-canonical NTP hydrolase)